MKVKQIKTNSASDTVVKQILENIESGELKPGDRLPTQEKLGELFGVGRSSIREATNALAIMGYLEISQGRGTFIKSTNPADEHSDTQLKGFTEDADLLNLIDIREVLECYAIERAAERADEKDLAAIQRAVSKLEECREDVGNFLAMDLEFHISLAYAAKRGEIGEIIKLIHNTINARVPVAFTTAKIDNIIKAIDTAKKIYTHVINGDGKQAARCLRNHLEITKEALANNPQQQP